MTHDHDQARRLMEAARPRLTTAQGGTVYDPIEEERAAHDSRVQSEYFTEDKFGQVIRQARAWGLSDDQIRSIFADALAFTTRGAASY